MLIDTSNLKRTQQKALLLIHCILSFTGLALLISGIIWPGQSDSIWRIFLMTFGGVFFGGSLATLISTGCKHFIQKKNNPSDDDQIKLNQLRREHHYYYVSWDAGKRYWRYLFFDFSKAMSGDRLKFTSEISHPANGTILKYRSMVYVRNQQIIMHHYGINSNDLTIDLFPLKSEFTAEGVITGISSHTDWDGNKKIDRAILAASPIHKRKTGDQGLIQNPDDEKLLDNSWLSDRSVQALLEPV